MAEPLVAVGPTMDPWTPCCSTVLRGRDQSCRTPAWDEPHGAGRALKRAIPSKVLLFDEPVNGLDADGVRWVRQLMRSFVDEGRTVFVPSHLMSEMQLTADHLVVIGRGRLIADAPLRTLVSASSRSAVWLRSPDAAGLAALRARMTADGYATNQPDRATLVVHGGHLGPCRRPGAHLLAAAA